MNCEKHQHAFVNVCTYCVKEKIAAESAISDIHSVDTAARARLEVAYAKERDRADVAERERDETLRISEGRREQLSRLACEKTIEWKRAENAEGIIAELEEAIAFTLSVYPGTDAKGVGPYLSKNMDRAAEKLRAALSAAPAQPATAAECECAKLGIACIHFAMRCAAPPSPAAREATTEEPLQSRIDKTEKELFGTMRERDDWMDRLASTKRRFRSYLVSLFYTMIRDGVSDDHRVAWHVEQANKTVGKEVVASLPDVEDMANRLADEVVHGGALSPGQHDYSSTQQKHVCDWGVACPACAKERK